MAPIAPFPHTWKDQLYGKHNRFIELAGEIKIAMLAYVVQKSADAFNQVGKQFKGIRLLALGIPYTKVLTICVNHLGLADGATKSEGC